MKKLAILLAMLALPAVALAAPPTVAVSIAAKPTTVLYHYSTALSGKVTPPSANQKVQILNRACGQASFSPSPKTEATTTTTGTYRTETHVLMKTAYQAKVKNNLSKTVTVTVRPRMRLKEVSAHHYRVLVWAAKSFAGKAAVFQRFTATGTWVRVRFVTLKFIQNGTVAPTIISGANFTSKLSAGHKVRVVLPLKQAAPCYLAGRTRPITN